MAIQTMAATATLSKMAETGTPGRHLHGFQTFDKVCTALTPSLRR